MKSLRLLAFAVLGMLAIAACDEGDSTTATAVEGTIRGTVTIDGGGASGIAVTLSTGASVTTDGSGNYAFNNVPAGTYVVELTGTPADATFASKAKTAVVSTAGQVVTVDFSGSFVRNSGIVGSVAVANVGPLAGVSVTLGGAASASTTTDAAGQYAFTGLRAGSYTVAISGFDAVQYTFPTTSKTASVGVGSTEIVSFSGTQVATAVISGALFLDENDKNNVYDGAALEELLAAANVAITLKGPAVGATQTTQTDAMGKFSFTDLVAGTYSVGINPADPDIPSYVAFGGDTTEIVVVLTPGQMVQVYYPFDIITQTVNVCVFTGIDAVSPGHRPVKGGSITLYPRKQDADNQTNKFATQVTDLTGCTAFSFARAADTSPQPGLTDHIVFAEIAGPPPGNYFLNGEMRIEIGYDARFATSESPDTFDVQNSRVVLARDGTTIQGVDTLAGWAWGTWTDSAQAAVAINTGVANSKGVHYSVIDNGGIAGLPRKLWTRLAHGQALAGGHAFEQTPDPDAPGGSGGELLTFMQDGFNLDSDTVWIGTEEIRYLDADINVTVFHEADDSLGTPMFTGGDDFVNVDDIEVSLWRLPSGGGSPVLLASTLAGTGTGVVVFPNISTDSAFAISAHPNPLLPLDKKVLVDTVYTTIADWGGVAQDADQCQQEGSAGCGTFSYKYTNGTIQGTVRAADGTDANGVRVVITPDPMNIQPNFTSSTQTVAAGSYFRAGVSEGPWVVTVQDSVGVWEYFGTGNPCKGVLDGSADNIPCSFTMTRMDTKILGVIVNDRDFDGTTIDPNEALGGVTVDLYRTKVDPDSLVGSTTSSGNGNYAFENLREGTYVVRAKAGANTAAVVTQGIQGSGLPHDTQVVKTAATTVGLGGQMTRQVGDTVVGTVGLPVLPAWNYSTSNVGGDDPTHFSFLFSNTTARAFIEDTGGNPVAGITATLQRCVNSSGFTSPPTGPLTCTTYTTESPVNASTNAAGMFEFSGLQEGVYQVTINPATGGYASATPATMLFQLRDAGDVEVPGAPFVVSNVAPPPPIPPAAYVANFNSNSVSVLDQGTNTVSATVAVGTNPYGVAVTPNGAFAYSANLGSGNVSVIDLATNTVTTTVAVGTSPIGVAITPNGATAYVSNLGSNNVTVIDVATNTVTTTIAVGTAPRAVAITPNGLTAYVTNSGSNNVSVISTATNTVTTTIAVGIAPLGAAFTPNGLTAYVGNSGSNNVSVIDVGTNTVTTTVAVGTGPLGVAITPNGVSAYVANTTSNNVSVIAVATNTVTTTVAVGTSPQNVAFRSNGATAYVTNLGSNNVSVIDVGTNTVTTTVAVGTSPTGVATPP